MALPLRFSRKIEQNILAKLSIFFGKSAYKNPFQALEGIKKIKQTEKWE